MFALIAQLLSSSFSQRLYTWGNDAFKGKLTTFDFNYRTPSNSASGANQAEIRMLGTRFWSSLCTLPGHIGSLLAAATTVRTAVRDCATPPSPGTLPSCNQMPSGLVVLPVIVTPVSVAFCCTVDHSVIYVQDVREAVCVHASQNLCCVWMRPWCVRTRALFCSRDMSKATLGWP